MKREFWVVLILLVSLLSAVAVGFSIDRAVSSPEASAEPEQVDLLITEVCAKNTDIIEDSRGKHSDYIEVYNRGGDCNLHGFTLSDGQNTSAPFGDTPLKAGEYKIFFVDRDITGFSISADGGENVFLKNRDGSVAAQVTSAPMGENQVMEWLENGYAVTNRPTPGFPNTQEGYLMFTVGMPDENPSVVINEILTSNRYSLPDAKGVFSDVVELYNRTDKDVSLSGYYLSDDKDNRQRFALPSVTLPAGGYLLVFCDGEGTVSGDEIHANFGLSVGETLYLTSHEGKYTTAEVTDLPSDRSQILAGTAYGEGAVSLGYPNTDEGEAAFAESRICRDGALVITEVLLSGEGTPYGGVFADAVELYNRGDTVVSTKGYYLTDGDNPYKYALPEKEIAPGECVVVICDGKNDGWHANFALSQGETLHITYPDHRYGEGITLMAVGAGSSLQIAYDTEGATCRGGDLSMGYPNTEEGRKAYLQSSIPQGLQISEVMASNASYLKGAYGVTCDWVELYNASDKPISLEGWYLTDDPDELTQGRLPAQTIQPGEYYIVLLSRETENLREGYPVVNFGLSSDGDCLYLVQEGAVKDWVITPALGTDVSFGRPDGEDAFAILAQVTHGEANGEAAKVSEIPLASTAQGVYNDISSLSVVLEGKGAIYYTTDCTAPTVLSPRYTGPILLDKTTVIRAICVENGKSPSEVLSLTYVINENHSLPVASLVTEPDNLWDYYNGIYVMGPGASSKFPYKGANFWKKWEKEADVSLFEMDGTGFSSPCGIRIFGAYSRALDMKSFSCFFRGVYGASELSYPLFGEQSLDAYEAFIFRNSGQDFDGARMRDALLTELASTAMFMPVQKNRPVILYLNGEFWGIYYIREKINENFIAGNFNVAEDEVIIDEASGNTAEYNELLSYVKKNDMADPDAYAYVESQMDIDQYIDYIILQIYIGNLDNGNIRFFKAGDGKWTWIMYDVDQSSFYVKNNTVAEHLNPAGTGTNDWFSTALINGLLKNPHFKEKFLRRFAWQIENVWNYERVNAAIDRYYQAILPDKERDCEKWNLSFPIWKWAVGYMRDFYEAREGYIVDYVRDWFRLTDAQMAAYGFDIQA